MANETMNKEVEALRRKVTELESENKAVKKTNEELTIAQLQTENERLRQFAELSYDAARVIVDAIEGYGNNRESPEEGASKVEQQAEQAAQ